MLESATTTIELFCAMLVSVRVSREGENKSPQLWACGRFVREDGKICVGTQHLRVKSFMLGVDVVCIYNQKKLV